MMSLSKIRDHTHTHKAEDFTKNMEFPICNNAKVRNNLLLRYIEFKQNSVWFNGTVKRGINIDLSFYPQFP